jgi:hypothetical protein
LAFSLSSHRGRRSHHLSIPFSKKGPFTLKADALERALGSENSRYVPQRSNPRTSAFLLHLRLHAPTFRRE